MTDALTHGPLLWFLNRGTGVAVLILLTLTLALGILTARPMRSRWIPGFVTRQLHRNVAVLSVVMVGLHAITAVIDSYVDIRWWQAFSPIGGTYKPLWLGLGSLAFDVMLVVALTSGLRTWMSQRAWRAIHLTSYLTWPVAVAHSAGIGTDAGTSWGRWTVVGCVGLLGYVGLWRWHAERSYRRTLTAAGAL